MAKKDLTVAAAPSAAPEVTPENTPVPGGGRWRWDITKPGWVEMDEDGALVVAAPDPAALAEQPTAELANTANPV
jgi:hypothetical protein